MKLHTRVCLVLLGSFLSFCILLCRKLDGYKFPVYSSEFCPRNQTEWNERSSSINCNASNGYMCLPNENRTELLEFCYIYPFVLIQEDICLYLYKPYSSVNAYNCTHFRYGCPNSSYVSDELYKHPMCTSIGDGCFLGELSCESTRTDDRKETTSHSRLEEETTSNNKNDSSTQEPTKPVENGHTKNTNGVIMNDTILRIFVTYCSICTLVFCVLLWKVLGRPICKRKSDEESSIDEVIPLFPNREQSSDFNSMLEVCNRTVKAKDDEETDIGSDSKDTEDSNSENDSNIEKHHDQNIIERWKQENEFFISTKASKAVEKITKRKNVVIVTGHSGSGKSAIIQNIALKYRSQGWAVKPITEVAEIRNAYDLHKEPYRNILFVFNDPFGKESFDEISYGLWKQHEEWLKTCFKNSKLLLSCRKCILNDDNIKGLLKDRSIIIDINNDDFKLNDVEKQKIFNIYSSNKNSSKKDLAKIVQIDEYFPLLCKLYVGNEIDQKYGMRFFKEPVMVLEEEIRHFKSSCKEKFCVLVLLVLFNNEVDVQKLHENNISIEKFSRALELCGLDSNISPNTIDSTYESMRGVFVQKIGDTYHFYHDLLMEVTTFVFGAEYPGDAIKYADIGFLRRRVKLKSCNDRYDQFAICLDENHISALGDRLFNDLFGERLIDVVLNPCLRDENIIKIFLKKLKNDPEKLKMLLKKYQLRICEQEFNSPSKYSLLSKFAFVYLADLMSPLDGLIIFCHTNLSVNCLKALQQIPGAMKNNGLFPAVCCNDSSVLFDMFPQDEHVIGKWGPLYPIHILSVFHKYENLSKLIQVNSDVNLKTDNGWTPLILAAGNDTKEEKNSSKKSKKRRNKTIAVLLRFKADINLCKKDGASPLLTACFEGYVSTVKYLVNCGANVNLRAKDGTSPLFIACQNGDHAIVKYLLSNGAKVDLCKNDETSPLSIACENGHASIVQLLLNKGASVDLCDRDGASPLFIACQNGHDSIVKLLLRHGASIDLSEDDGVTPLYIACQNRHYNTARILLKHDANIDLCKEDGASPIYIACLNENLSIVQLLLNSKTDINMCLNDGTSPLYAACQNGNVSIVQLLISNGAKINACMNDGASPLYIACYEGHVETTKILLENKAIINLCEMDGTSPLYIACQNDNINIVQLLLRHKADINQYMVDGASPLYIACQNGNISIVQLLLRYKADINQCMVDGASPLYAACQNGNDSIVKLLLKNGANINLCMEDGASPLYIACYDGHESTVHVLLRYGAKIDSIMEDGVSPLYIACYGGFYNIVEYLLQKGATINLSEEEGATPLYIACQQGHARTVELLLSNGANINLCAKDGATPLFIACQNGHEGIVNILLIHEADINLCKKNGASPFYIACQNRHYTTAELLFKKLCTVNGETHPYAPDT